MPSSTPSSRRLWASSWSTGASLHRPLVGSRCRRSMSPLIARIYGSDPPADAPPAADLQARSCPPVRRVL